VEEKERRRELSAYADALEWGLANREHITDETVRAFLDLMHRRISERERGDPDPKPQEPEPEGQRTLVVL